MLVVAFACSVLVGFQGAIQLGFLVCRAHALGFGLDGGVANRIPIAQLFVERADHHGVWLQSGSEQDQRDQPAQGFDASMTSVQINDSFKTYTLYRPPGTDSLFVPLKNLNWYWQGAAAPNPNASEVWSVSNPAALWSFLADFPAHPVWGPTPPWNRGNVAPLTFSPPVP